MRRHLFQYSKVGSVTTHNVSKCSMKVTKMPNMLCLVQIRAKLAYNCGFKDKLLRCMEFGSNQTFISFRFLQKWMSVLVGWTTVTVMLNVSTLLEVLHALVTMVILEMAWLVLVRHHDSICIKQKVAFYIVFV